MSGIIESATNPITIKLQKSNQYSVYPPPSVSIFKITTVSTTADYHTSA